MEIFYFRLSLEYLLFSGQLRIPMKDIRGRSMVEKWYPLSSANSSSSEKAAKNAESIQLRVSARYHAVDILPTEAYTPLVQVRVRSSPEGHSHGSA